MLKPDLYLTSVLKITPQMLKRISVCALILDVDNTIRQHNVDGIIDGVFDWVNLLKASGISIVIVSNNFEKNIRPVAEVLDLPYFSFSFKPFPFGLRKAEKKLNCKKGSIAIVGDQFFTDIVGGKLRGFKTILVKPLREEKGLFWKIRRSIEKIILDKIL